MAKEKAPKKPPTLASLVRLAGAGEETFIAGTLDILQQHDNERSVEYLTRLNLPRDFILHPDGIPSLEGLDVAIVDWQTETVVIEGMEKFIERHIRKLKWLVNHPDTEAVNAGVGLYRAMCIMTELRIRRVMALLVQSEVLNPIEWGTARELLNRAYRDFRRASSLLTHQFYESMVGSVDRDDVRQALSPVPKVMKAHIVRLASLRDEVEVARLDLAVQPEGYPMVRPPRYFGGDLMETMSWKHFWGEVGTLQDNMRQHVDLL
jgi:hypothetical protein